MSEPYRLLHASDLHLSNVPYSAGSRHPNWLSKLKRYKLIGHDDAVLRAFARFVYYYGLQRNLFDIALLTGDLAKSGFRRDLQRALDFLTASPSNPATPVWVDHNNEPTIAFFPCAAMPGNHDRYRRNAPLFMPGGTLFDQLFHAFWQAGQGAQPWRLLQKPYTRPLAIIAADFTLHPNDSGKPVFALPGWYGQGRVDQQIVMDLKTATQDVKEYCTHPDIDIGEPAVIWAIHFDAAATDELLKLLDSDFLVQAAADAHVPALLCGHTHESKIKPLSATTTAFVCGTTSQANIGSAQDYSTTVNDCQLLVIDVQDDPKRAPAIEVTWFRYDSAQGRFLEIPSQARLP